LRASISAENSFSTHETVAGWRLANFATSSERCSTWEDLGKRVSTTDGLSARSG